MMKYVVDRVVQVGASNLRLMEAKRVDFYVWSAGFGSYFKVRISTSQCQALYMLFC